MYERIHFSKYVRIPKVVWLVIVLQFILDIFCVNQIMQKEHSGDGIVFILVDMVAFFDRENIVDVMDTRNEIWVNKKAARYFFKLNEGTEVVVKTTGGLSNTAFVGDCIGQGTAGGAIVSAANLDQGLKQYFEGSQD